MSSRSIFISHSDQDHLNSPEYLRILSEYDKTKKQYEAVKKFSLLNFFISLLTTKPSSEKEPLQSDSLVEFYGWTPVSEEEISKLLYCQFAPRKKYSSRSKYSWSWLFDIGQSLYTLERRLYKKLKKLESQLKYFFSHSKTHNLLYNLFDSTCTRIHAMMISDKSGEGDALSKCNEWKEVLPNHFNYCLNEKESYSKYYT